MKVIRKGSDEPFQDLFPGTYEFKLCGGSILPEDRVSPDGQGEDASCQEDAGRDGEQEADGGTAAGKEEQHHE